MSRGSFRESELPEVPPGRGPAAEGRRCISVIGIDRYRSWDPLRNAVGDARGVLAEFKALGFEPVIPPLLDGDATREAIRALPHALKPKLEGNDSLIVFFAGHGHTTTEPFLDGYPVSRGYLIPVDADRAARRDDTWQHLDHWLEDLAGLPPRHILVILDSCRSGFALSRNIQHRGTGVRADGSSVPLSLRRSRRVLTSALADQAAADGGPIAGHSVFTGCLIEALRGGAGYGEQSQVGMQTIASYVHERVLEHSGERQVPEFGYLEFHDSGELRLPRKPRVAGAPPQADPVRPPVTPALARSRGQRATIEAPRLPPSAPTPQPTSSRTTDGGAVEPLPERTEGWTLDPEFAAALDRHGEERRRGAAVLTLVAGDALAAQAAWGTWAARHGRLTLATQAADIDAVIADLLSQTPWLRCVPAARKRLAAAAGIDAQAVDASLDARSPAERRTWIDDVAGLDTHARVSGWLLSWLRHPTARVPDLSSAPVRAGELLAIACELTLPTAVLLFHPAPDEHWLARAIATAASLMSYLPTQSVAVTAPAELVARVLSRQRSGAAWTMARQGLVAVESLARRLPGRSRHRTMRALFEALDRDPRTRGRFELDGKVATSDGPVIDVALIARDTRICVELDAWYQFHDPEGYRRDRVQDTRLVRAGYFVLRFPAEDVDDRLASTVDQLALALAGRRAVRALL